jgi:NADH-quinone oxidoreductase subunit L
MFKTETLMVLIPASPLVATFITALFGKFVLKERSHIPVVVALAASFLLSLVLLFRVAGLSEQASAHDHDHDHAAAHEHAADAAVGFEKVVNVWTWASIDDVYEPPQSAGKSNTAAIAPAKANFRVDIALRADPLTCIMLSMVTFISTLVAIYAAGYMHGDPGYWRFFTYVSLFVFSMTMLVSVSNFVLLYVFWEAVGLCSYLLIGFWFQKPEAAAAGKKAFLVNRIGDFGFALGVFLIWTTYGTLNFHDVHADGTVISDGHDAASKATASKDTAPKIAGVLGQTRLANPDLYKVGACVSLLIALGLFTGACGKSAQFPLHVWLPDAMEGPTPVSALIHAATMVTAGVYLVTRCTPLFVQSPDAQLVVSCIGGFTALLTGIIAVTQNDLKRVLAYSTVGQLGYMFLALGTGTLGGIIAGMFHLFTHAFFKALLFLGAGSVMHAMGGIVDMRRFGGLRRIMPKTCWTFWFGCLALAGIFPFAGFWSKDSILSSLSDKAGGHIGLHGAGIYGLLYLVASFAALLTAFYTFRALFLTFYGETRVPPEAGHHAHESPSAMTIPLMILAACSVLVGVYFEITHGFANFLSRTPSLSFAPVYGHGPHIEFNFQVAAISTVIALIGVGLAAYFYLGDKREIGRITEFMKSGYGLRLYQLSYGKFFLDQIDNALVVQPLRLLAVASYWLDRWVVDGLVNLFGWIPRALGSMLRVLQTGMVQFYALAMVLGVLVLVGALLVWPVG